MIPDPLGQAMRWLRAGGLVAYPTETVWGLAAAADSAQAMQRLARWKRREGGDPVAILVESVAEGEALGCELSPPARRLAAAHWPGPLTLVVRCSHRFAEGVARADGAVGLRCSSHPLATALARRARREGVGPLTATSLNRHGEPPARSADEASRLCGDDDAPRMLAVEGAEAGGDTASTVVDATLEPPCVLRWGAIARDEIENLLERPGAA
jgi:L-threonylcarbamoyladenylate synthase